jgi:hypothetical protein
MKVVYDHTCCSDHADPFFIEKGCPAEREADEKETSRDVVHVISTCVYNTQATMEDFPVGL